MSARFRSPDMLRTYASCVDAFNGKHGTLFTKGMTPNISNSLGAYFWQGFDGVATNRMSLASRWDAASRKTLAYAAYRAGSDCAGGRA